MELSDWITLAAVLLGPILAVQAQKWLELLRENKNRRLLTFKRLMATRGAPVSPGHVEALNMIDLEFSGRGKKDRRVRQRWKEYLDHLGSLREQPPEQQKQQLAVWSEKNHDLLAELLYEMSQAVGYREFDKVHIKRGIYAPQGHANIEWEFEAIRKLLIDVLTGVRSIPMDVRSLPQIPPAQPPEIQNPGT